MMSTPPPRAVGGVTWIVVRPEGTSVKGTGAGANASSFSSFSFFSFECLCKYSKRRSSSSAMELVASGSDLRYRSTREILSRRSNLSE